KVADMTQLQLEYRWADIPENAPSLHAQERDLPGNWKEIPWPQSTQEIGTKWMTRADYLFVSVPSVVLPMERNFIVNPAHHHFPKIRLGPPLALDVDARLFSA